MEVPCFWCNGLLMVGLDLCFPKFMDQFRVQTDKKQRSGNKHFRGGDQLQRKEQNLKKLIKNIAFNSALLPFMLGAYGYIMQFYSPFPLKISREIPNPRDMSWQMLVNAAVFNEIVFFYGHWLFHANKWLYKNVHKVHHEWTSPNAFAALYCHPLEVFVSDIMPMSIGLFLVNAHAYAMLCWIALGIIGTQTHHSGLRFPWALADHQAKFHDLQHQYFNGNYGNIGFLDWIHGTAFTNDFLVHAEGISRPGNKSVNGDEEDHDDDEKSTDCECYPATSVN